MKVLLKASDHVQQVEKLLFQAMYNWSISRKKAWMKWQFDPDHMILLEKDRDIIAFLQYEPSTFEIDDKLAAASRISLIAVHPSFLQEGCYEKLIDAFVSLSSYNELLCCTLAEQPKLYAKKKFETVYKVLEYTLNQKQLKLGNDRFVYRYEKGMDLYAIYCRFMEFFSSTIYFDEGQFWDWIQYLLESKFKISVAMDENRNLEGFCIYQIQSHSAQVYTAVYLNSQALLNLLKDLSMTNSYVSVLLSENERIDKFVQTNPPRIAQEFLLRINNLTLFNRWQDSLCKSVSELYQGENIPWIPAYIA